MGQLRACLSVRSKRKHLDRVVLEVGLAYNHLLKKRAIFLVKIRVGTIPAKTKKGKPEKGGGRAKTRKNSANLINIATEKRESCVEEFWKGPRKRGLRVRS